MQPPSSHDSFMSDPADLPAEHTPPHESADEAADLHLPVMAEAVAYEAAHPDEEAQDLESFELTLPAPPIAVPTARDKVKSRDKNGPPSHRDDIVIPDYTLLKRIGSGAYGEVWLAQSVT
uniref:hypothetical protein n=1 Tax=Prosthecobacter sp. TaxID=1965333 RepID=UPI0037C958DD